MKRVKALIVEAVLLSFGLAASIFAYVDTKRAWISLVIALGSVSFDVVLERLRKTQEGNARP